MRAFLLILTLAGCADNQRHCERSTESINRERVACGLEPLNINATCFAYAELDDLDCRRYFECQADRITCVDGQLVQDLGDCPSCD
jgi:hypothetical protein